MAVRHASLQKEWIVSKFDWLNAIHLIPMKPSSKLLLLTLASFANAAGENVFPSSATMVERSGLSRATVFRHLKVLRAAGHIRQVGRVSKYNRTWRYAIDVEKIMSDAGIPMRLPESQKETDKVAACDSQSLNAIPSESQSDTQSGQSINQSEQTTKPDIIHHPSPPASPDDDEVIAVDHLIEDFKAWTGRLPNESEQAILRCFSEEQFLDIVNACRQKRIRNPRRYLETCLMGGSVTLADHGANRHLRIASGEWADFFE